MKQRRPTTQHIETNNNNNNNNNNNSNKNATKKNPAQMDFDSG